MNGLQALEDAKDEREIREREKEARELMRRLENLYDLAEAGDIARDVFRERKAKIDANLTVTQEALRKIAERKAEQQRALENLAGVIELCEQVRERLPLIPIEERRAFYLAIGLRVIVGPETVRIEGRLGAHQIDDTQLIPSRAARIQPSVSISGY